MMIFVAHVITIDMGFVIDKKAGDPTQADQLNYDYFIGTE